jgi:hypothetical protein
LAEVLLEQGRAAEAVQLAERSLAAAPPDDLPERHHKREQLLARAKARAR